jgi:hypothetical protein
MLTSGTSTTWRLEAAPRLVPPPRTSGAGPERRGAVPEPPGTLLGPEGSGASAPLGPVLRRTTRNRGYATVPGDRLRPHLENCTVDASIFVATSY